MKIYVIIQLLFCISYAQAQNITGKITDANSNPVELAFVVVHTVDSVYIDAAYTDSLGN